MSSFKRLSTSDVITIPYIANKEWSFSYVSASLLNNDPYINWYEGMKITGSFDPLVDPIDNNGSYQRTIYDSINHLFYQQFPENLNTSSLASSLYYISASEQRPTASYYNYDYNDNIIKLFPTGVGQKISVLSISRNLFGTSLNPGTLNITSSLYHLKDDSNGNVYDSNSGSLHVGNIFYSLGIVVITNQDYVNFIYIPPATTTTTTTTSTTTTTQPTTTTTSTTTSTTTAPTITGEWIPDEDTSYCETEIIEQTVITGFASPQNPSISADNLLFYVDSTLDGVIYFDPTTIVSGSDATLIPITALTGSHSRPSGDQYLHTPTNKLYVNSFWGGGLTVIDCSTKAVIHTIPYGTDGIFSRGNVYYISSFNEIWAVGNSGFLRINATTEAVITGSFSLTGAASVAEANSKIYVIYDSGGNKVDIYNTSLTLLDTITGLCQNHADSGNYVSRGLYVDSTNNKIYLGETSTTGGVIVIDTISDTITNRISLDNEGDTYVGPGVIDFNPLRNTVYIGGQIYNTILDSQAKLWAFDTSTETITQTITPSINSNLTSIIYYPPNNKVYVGAPGRIPESSPNTGQATDGIIFIFN